MHEKIEKIQQLLKRMSHRKLLVVGIGISAVLLLVIILSVTLSRTGGKSTDNTAEQVPTVPAVLTFTPERLSSSGNPTLQSSSIFIDVSDNSLGRIDLKIVFSPGAIESFDIQQSVDDTALSNSFTIEKSFVSIREGYAELTLKLKDNAREQIGKAEIGKIYFMLKPNFFGQTQIQIEQSSLTSMDQGTRGKFETVSNTLTVIKSK